MDHQGQSAPALSDLRQKAISSGPRFRKWESTRGLLKYATREAAAQDWNTASVRIDLLKVPEPPPLLEDFVPSKVPDSASEADRMLAETQRRFEKAVPAHLQREQVRLSELRTAESAYAPVAAAKLAERLERQLRCWPEGLILGPDIASVDGIEPQVRAKNAEIERRFAVLSNLLANGLATLPVSPSADSGEHHPGGAIDPIEVCHSVETALALMDLGAEFEHMARAAYTVDSRQAVVEYELPDVNVIPKVKSYRYVKSRDEVIESLRPQSQLKVLYASTIAQLTLLCVANIFAGDTRGAIDVAVFNGIVDTLDPRSGRPIRPCLITLRATRDAFAGINLAHVDPQACLKHLSAAVSKSPTELTPVRPVLEFSMVDPRFVTATDALTGLDERPNLLELTPTQFEVLIQNLFTSMGLEAKQTRASRDGGVDCVAYDTRPIFGGKIVIQAKRYKSTVGVSAVRDLYGTLQNEGASKGILVTTSGYGPASFEFAQNKPIELIEGANLLYLLETHTGVKARIEPPDDWHDPIPDSPDPSPD